MLLLSNFSVQRPAYEIAQGRALDWLGELHTRAYAAAEGASPAETLAFSTRIKKLIQRSACGAEKIGRRGHVTADLGSFEFGRPSLYDVTQNPHGGDAAARSERFSELVNAYFEREFADETQAPSELIHVTCTGYVAPSGAQRVVAKKGWGRLTHVTHAYHMGCYAAFPALRMAAGHLSLPEALRPGSLAPRVDIVHTELCTLHLDPSQHSAEQCVVQSLFGDGFIRYCLRDEARGPGLEVLALSENVLPDSADSMTWRAGNFGMQMTLARDVPGRIAGHLRQFVSGLFESSKLDVARDLRDAIVAVHPGGPRIIDGVREVLELDDAQVQTSREVLFDYGNMSSATLPHVWSRLLADQAVPRGALIVSLAFGPGLTVCGGLFRKC